MYSSQRLYLFSATSRWQFIASVTTISQVQAYEATIHSKKKVVKVTTYL